VRVAHVDTGRDWRGGQAQVALLLAGLRARGHDLLLAVPPGAPLAARAVAAGVACLTLRAGGDLEQLASGRLARALRPFAPELLHAHTARAHTIARAAGRALGVPVVVSRRVVVPPARNPFSRRKYATGVARYLCISRAVVDAMRAAGIDARRLALVPSAVDVEALGQVRARIAAGGAHTPLATLAGAPAGAPVAGTAAALTREKGIDAFTAAAAAAPAGVRWVWIGDGPERARLERACRARGVAERVRVLGFRDDAHELVAQLALFVSASTHEGLGTAVLEAQALGVPVVATDSGGVRDAIEDGVNGRLADGPGALPAAVAAALGDPATLERWRDAALATVARFTPGAMVERTLAEYASVRSEAAAGAAG